ncbi:29008_t:CDS:1, partial [Racocetra persica]
NDFDNRSPSPQSANVIINEEFVQRPHDNKYASTILILVINPTLYLFPK